MGEPQFTKFPDLALSQNIFQISNPASSEETQKASLKYLEDAIKEHKMAPLYRYLAHPTDGIMNAASAEALFSPGPETSRSQQRVTMPSSMLLVKRPSTVVTHLWNESLYQELLADNEKELASIQKEEDDATEQAGDVEILAAQGKRAEFWTRIGDKEKAVSAYEAMLEKTGVVGTKIDILLAIIRIGMFFGNKVMVRKYIEKASALVETGGDWDRRNRLKAYEGLHLLTIRSYAAAAPLLLDSLSTFASYELCNYSSLVVYATLAGSVALKRVDFKAKVVDAPEIKAILGNTKDKLLAISGAISAGPSAGDEEMSTDEGVTRQDTVDSAVSEQSAVAKGVEDVDFSVLASLVTSLYRGEYSRYFRALADIEVNFLVHDRHLYEHRRWYVHEMRLRGYQQLLQSYRVVSLSSMSNDFGVTPEYLERDLSHFIAAGRLSCTIDSVAGLIETNRPDDKNKQYMEVLKVGDHLITKLQKYGQSVRLRGSELN